MSLLVLGTVALDHVRTPLGARQEMLGGSAAHFAMSARLFTDVHLVAVVGEDFPGRHLRFLSRKNLDLTSLKVVPGKSFRWHGEYRKEDLNRALTLATELGVLIGFVPRIAQHQEGIPNVFLANIDPDIQMGLLQMTRKPRLIGLDSMNLWITHKKPSLLNLLKRVNLFVANDGEARALSGEQNLIKAAKILRRMGPELVIIKKGEHGVLFDSDRVKCSFPAFPVDRVVDPTGAGDTFAGGVMGYLSTVKTFNARALKRALIYGTALASFNVQGFGMQRTAYLTLPLVEKRIKQLINFMSY